MEFSPFQEEVEVVLHLLLHTGLCNVLPSHSGSDRIFHDECWDRDFSICSITRRREGTAQ